MAMDKAVLKDDGWHYFLDGRPCTEGEYKQRYPDPEPVPGGVFGGTQSGGWPMRSVALACHPDQVPEMNERNRRRGNSTRYDPKTGEAIIPDAASRRQLLKIEGFYDRDGYD